MKAYWVYIVRCADGSYYTGVTNSLEARVGQHQAGNDPTCYTYKRRPVTLLYSHAVDDVHDAIAWEKRLKGWGRRKKEALIQGDERALHELASCRNHSHSQNFIEADDTHVMVSGDEP